MNSKQLPLEKIIGDNIANFSDLTSDRETFHKFLFSQVKFEKEVLEDKVPEMPQIMRVAYNLDGVPSISYGVGNKFLSMEVLGQNELDSLNSQYNTGFDKVLSVKKKNTDGSEKSIFYNIKVGKPIDVFNN